MGFPDYDEQRPRARADYFGMLRLIDDQCRRLVEFLQAKGLRRNTIIVFVSDHGDFVGEYGLVRKGPELPECLTRVPMFWTGPGIVAAARPHPAHVSMVDIMPTLCEAVGVPLPAGVQGRSLWPMLTGKAYPEEEFASVYAEQGFGGLHYTADDTLDPRKDGLNPAVSITQQSRLDNAELLAVVNRANELPGPAQISGALEMNPPATVLAAGRTQQ